MASMVAGLGDILDGMALQRFKESYVFDGSQEASHLQMLRVFYSFCRKFSGRCTIHYGITHKGGLLPFMWMRHFTGVMPSHKAEIHVFTRNEF